jgi:hypothetical protein
MYIYIHIYTYIYSLLTNPTMKATFLSTDLTENKASAVSASALSSKSDIMFFI